MKSVLAFCLLTCAALPAQQTPAPTQLPPSPFFIKHTWFIGGAGDWDYLTMDPQANRLFIAHSGVVQVVDTETGTLAGQVTGLHFAHSIALDDTGAFGYVSDGPASQVDVFDRRTFKIVARIATDPSPRALVFEPQTKLVFAVSASPLPPGSFASRPGIHSADKSSVTVIDANTRAVIATIFLPGKLGFAAANGAGQIFVVLQDRSEIAWIDVASMEARLRGDPRAAAASAKPHSTKPAAPVLIDWSALPRSVQDSGTYVRFFPLGSDCPDPRGIAIDSKHMRLFAACNNLTMKVMNAFNGEIVTTLPIGPGVDAVGYDPDRGLIYSANGAGVGSLTVIRQDVTDTYAVIQILATRQRARTLAVNPVNGDVYLVTDYLTVALDKPGDSALHSREIPGSFQVLVVSH